MKTALFGILLITIFFQGCVNKHGISAKYYSDCKEYYDLQGYYHKECGEDDIVTYKQMQEGAKKVGKSVKSLFIEEKPAPRRNVW